MPRPLPPLPTVGGDNRTWGPKNNTALADLRSTGRTWYSVADYLDGLAADHTDDLKALIDDNGPGADYYVPDGFTVKLPVSISADRVQLRHKVRLLGEGPGSVIQVSGFGADPGDDYAAMGISWTEQDGDVEDAGLENLTVQGDADPDLGWTERQASAFRIISFGDEINRTTFRNVIFRDIDGFSIHADGYAEKNMLVERCSFINNGNGLNPNGLFTTIRDNYFHKCEGIETCGAGTQVIGNLFEDIFLFAISLGGDNSQDANKKTLPSQVAMHNRIFGVQAGGVSSLGHGIVTSESSPDCLILGNYIERTYGCGIVTTHNTLTGPDDGHTIMGNIIANASAASGLNGRVGILSSASNVRMIGNRVYNRTALASDPFSVTGWGVQRGIQINDCDNVYLDGNDIDMSVNPSDTNTQYALAFSAATNIRMGKNRLISNAGYPKMELTSGSTCAEGSGLNTDTLNTTDSGWNSIGFRWIKIDSTGGVKTINLQKASFSKGAQITITAPAGGTNAVTVARDGSDTINGSAADKTLSSNYAQIHLVSDGTGWIILGTQGTVS